MRVLHIMNELAPSGAETMLCIGAKVFQSAGVDATVLSTGSSIGSFSKEFKEAGYKVEHVVFGKSLAFFKELYIFLRNSRFDIIHIHAERANFWIGLVSLAARPNKVIRTVHSNFLFNGNLRIRRLIQRRILQWFGLVHVSIGPSVQANELSRFGLKTTCIPNWYDDNSFLPTSVEEKCEAREMFKLPNDVPVIVSVGNCSPAKNHGVLLEAIAMFPPVKRPIYLHVGCEQYKYPERILAENLNIVDSVRFLGPLADIRPALRAADIFVMPSHYEGFSIAALEGLSSGLPAIFSDVPGLRDLKQVYDGLFWVQPDKVSVYDALNDVLSLPAAARNQISQDYFNVSKNTFGIEKGVYGYLVLYGCINIF